MRRSVAAALVLSGFLCACSTTAEPQTQPSSGDFAGEEKIRFRTEGSGEPGVVDYALVPVENVVYVPWKMVGGSLKGAADGVGCGFSKDRMPALGILFAPVNLAAGFVTGFFEGLALDPVLVGPSSDFSRAMSQPTQHATTIWWYQ